MTVLATSRIGDRASDASALTDGKRETVAKIDPGGADTIDLIFGFGGETVAPRAIVVVHSNEAGSAPPARIEVLASIVSPRVGRWLHRTAMKKGYRASQTDLSVLLDEQTFNCVSSAVLYNIIAKRLGIDARAIEVPDHAFSIVYLGTSHIDVETTSALGFNPDRDQIKAFERTTGFRYVPRTLRHERREVTEAGLAALIYLNRGVDLSRAKLDRDALQAYFSAMSLDSELVSAAKAALATLADWGRELVRQRQWQQAIDVVSIGVELAPNDAVLTSSQHAIWTRWALSLIDAGQQDEAIAVLARAAKALPRDGFETLQAWVYIKPGEDLVKAGKWQAAFSTTGEGLTKLDPVPRRKFVEWRNDLYLRWANAEIDAGQFEAAAAALTGGLKAFPGDPRVAEIVGYLGYEWTKRVSKTQDWEAVADFYAQGLSHFPDDEYLRKSAAYLAQEWARAAFAKGGGSAINLVARLAAAKFPALPDARQAVIDVAIGAVNDNVSAGDFEDATTLVDQMREILPSATATQLFEFTYGAWAERYIVKQQCRKAVNIYDQGLKHLPENNFFKESRAYCLAQPGK